ncbi:MULTISPECIES: hypothetical protein [Streptomyces]|uniref:Uncharacterized protein n=1 Tax=Streptomyces venezuelae TaxID=54571 RepID=A0A5P2AXE6_STRVZ|nr:hypothetical protein [Streptomyces venezuelae]QES22447.1 hypothetical protein DEJ46_27875 [Streptomyces venezuelae]
MSGADWDDDSGYTAAVRRTRVLMVIGLIVSVGVIGVVLAAVFGVSFLVDLVNSLAEVRS